jgi:prepilin-type N-terminal cleavage/methylation domain-containing protein
MANRRGFTLIETLITTLVLVTGLAAVAGLFSYGARTNFQNRQRTAATALLYGKMEEMRNASVLAAGQYTESLSIQPDGSVTSSINSRGAYLRVSNIESGAPQRVTVIVYGRQSNRGNSYMELARATVLVGRGF